MKRLGTGEKRPGTLEMSPELRTVQYLMPMSDEDRDRLAEDIKANGVRHPLIIYNHDGKNLVLAGWHRREIAVALGLPSVPVETVEASPKERREFCITENLARRHLTATQKRDIIEYLLKLDPAKSNKSIAKETGTTKETVKAARTRLQTGGEIRPVKSVKGADGKAYTVKPKAPSRSTSARSPKHPGMTAQLVDYIGALDARAERMYSRSLKMSDKHAASEERAIAKMMKKIAAELARIIAG